MTKKELIEKYPFLRNLGLRFSCDPGWLDLLDNTFFQISEIIQKDQLKDFKINQIKEKFSSLRIYVSNANEEIQAIIDDAEKVSANICERCGSGGELQIVRGCYKTLCPDCLPVFVGEGTYRK